LAENCIIGGGEGGVFVDILGFEPLGAVFKTHRPDIVVHKNKTIYICELTVCHKLNLKLSKEY